MQIAITRVGKLMLTTREHHGKTYYSLDDILEQINKKPQHTLMEQNPIKINCGITFGYRFSGENIISSVFVDDDGLKMLAWDYVKEEFV